jgi:hypothetical protein
MEMKTFGGCTYAYAFGFGCLVRCTVIGVRRECTGMEPGDPHDLVAQVDQTAGGFRDGEIIHGTARDFPPRSMVTVADGKSTIDRRYRWVKGI